jgi:hypothetical protein
VIIKKSFLFILIAFAFEADTPPARAQRHARVEKKRGPAPREASRERKRDGREDGS